MRRNESNFPVMVKDETCMESITTDFHSSTFQQHFHVDEAVLLIFNDFHTRDDFQF